MTSIITRPIWFALALVLAAFVAVLAIGPNNTSALSQNEFERVLASNGYRATVGDSVDHPTLSIDGRIIVVELNGRIARVEFLDYGTQAKLKLDFVVVNGEGPKPIKATHDFDGKILYWNNDSVLVVDYNAPNDAVIARAAANSYLGLPGEGGEEPGQPASPTPTAAPSTGSPTAPTQTPGELPGAGGDPGGSDDGNAMALGLAIIAAGSLVTAVVLFRQRQPNS